ncbi:purine-nucleoside phosphorylase [Desulfoluna spongiiphila]|uniref:purine-nucleoside phosphorylase n=1 Tax=Desulfoluna spongiiphila TaxID=419481 RepID=UPI0012544642|nr:purine-nucleoside phosphorylase [Desulfoluna spongiiphila]VVS93860.1 purine nucleoside phosphorylase [Desulfoluna spongiiphila]
MDESTTRLDRAAEYIRSRWSRKPEILIMAGTGLSDCAGFVSEEASLMYGEIPGFPLSTVESHTGCLLCGDVSGTPVMVMQGRFHLYEGYTAREVTFPIRVARFLGARTLIVTNAAGGLNPTFKEGGIMVIQDHLNLTGENPLVGPNNDDWGLRFPSMIHAYNRDLSDMAFAEARNMGVPVCRGVYGGLKGPSLETPAEMRWLRTIGADCVGFSTVMEVIAATHAGMNTLGLSLITNINDPDNPEEATVEKVLAVAEKARPGFEKVLKQVIGRSGHRQARS